MDFYVFRELFPIHTILDSSGLFISKEKALSKYLVKPSFYVINFDNLSVSHRPRNGFMILIQLFLIRPFKLYWAGRLMEYSLDNNLSYCGNVSLSELKTSFDKFNLINRLSRLPPAIISKKPMPVTIM